VEVVFMTLLLGPMKCFFIDVLLVCYEPCVFGRPGRVRDPFIVEDCTTHLISPRTYHISFL